MILLRSGSRWRAPWADGWAKMVKQVTPDVSDDQATQEVRALKGEIKDLKDLLVKFIEGKQGNSA
jgi:hypothetical protein